MWAALIGLLVEIIKLVLYRFEQRRRLTDAERDLAEDAHDRAVDVTKAKLIAARDQVRKEREAARRHYEKSPGSPGAPGSDE